MKSPRATGARPPARPRLELLEDRAVPALLSPEFNVPVDVGASPQLVVLGKFGGGQPLDLATSNQNASTVSIRTGTGSASFDGATNVTSKGIGPEGLVAGRFHGPAAPLDLAVANNFGAGTVFPGNVLDGTVTILTGNGTGGFTPGTPITVPRPAGGTNALLTYVAAGAFHGPAGNVDLAVSDFNNGTVTILNGQGNGTFAVGQRLTGLGNPNEIAVADLDGDGKLDLAVADSSTNNVVRVFRGAGDGTFTFASAFGTGGRPVQVVAADLGGPRLDLVVSNNQSGSVTVLHNASTPGVVSFTSAAADTYAVGTNPVGLAVEDMTGDGVAEIVVANSGSGTIGVLVGTGGGAFRPQQTFSTGAGSQPIGLAVGDVNGDGLKDVVVTDQAANQVKVFTSQLTPTTLALTATPPTTVAGQPVSLTVTLTAANGSPINSGRVRFFDNGSPIGTANVTGSTATLSVSLPAGSHTLRADYSDSTALVFAPSSGTVAETVNPAPGGGGTTGGGTGTTGTTPSVSAGPVLVGGTADGTAVLFTPTGGTLTAGDPTTFFSGLGVSVRTASADVNGDGVADLIGATGPGPANRVVILDGKTKGTIASFSPFESSFTGGLFVAAADLDGDGKAEVILTPDRGGGPVLAVYSGAKLAAGQNEAAQIVRFLGIADESFRGGCRAAIGDVNGDKSPDVVVSAGFLGGPRIAVFDGKGVAAGIATPTRLVADFFAFEDTVRNGAFVAVGDVDGDGFADLVFGGGPTGAPRVRVVSGKNLLAAGGFANLDQVADKVQVGNFFAGDPSLRGGVRLVLRDTTGDGRADLIAGSGEGEPSRVRVYNATKLVTGDSTPVQDFDPFGAVLTNGVFVG